MTTLWCGRCRVERPMDWFEDFSFGPGAESARCPVCGTVWGVRARRQGALQRTKPPETASDGRVEQEVGA